MADENREAINLLIQRLTKESHRFSFFQAVFLLEQYCSSISKIAHIGDNGPANVECIRFKSEASLAFPLSDIASIEKIDDKQLRFQIVTSFLGLYGTDSPLPDFYTEDIIQGDPDQTNIRDFMDIFHHRIVSLFYRCWLKYRYYLQYQSDGEDDFSRRVFSLIGMGTSGIVENLNIPSVRLLRYVGLFMQQSRSASGLESILSDYFDGIPVHIEQCIGRWIKINNDDISVLGKSNSQLGNKVTIGERVFDRTGKFRVTLELSSFAEFRRFLPNGDYFSSLKEVTEAFLPCPMDYEVELILPGSEVPSMQMSSEFAPQLGWTGWLASEKPEENVSVIFQAN
jgi:type VI secretion system protein ImpH